MKKLLLTPLLSLAALSSPALADGFGTIIDPQTGNSYHFEYHDVPTVRQYNDVPWNERTFVRRSPEQRQALEAQRKFEEQSAYKAWIENAHKMGLYPDLLFNRPFLPDPRLTAPHF